jgi:O-antigen ligase
LWLIALTPTLDVAGIRRVLATPAGALPALLFGLAALGMLWADVAWNARFEGLVSHLKLAAIPLLFVQFSRSDRGLWAIYALLAACTALLVTSYVMTAFPSLAAFRGRNIGVPVKDYISQSGFFVLAAFVLLDIAFSTWRRGRRLVAVVCGLLIVAFLANIVWIATGRTALLVAPVLILLYGFRRAGWRGAVAACIAVAVLAAIAWSASPYLRQRIQSTLVEQVAGSGSFEPSATVLRLAFWKASLEIISQAPIVGHGTGSIRANFERYAAGRVNSHVEQATNPHNQTFAVAIQLGLVGTLVLYAMWLSHFLLFRGDGLLGWFGAAVVVQNFIGSLVNTHLFDFTQGWTYAVLVGVAGGTMLRETAGAAAGRRPRDAASA